MLGVRLHHYQRGKGKQDQPFRRARAHHPANQLPGQRAQRQQERSHQHPRGDPVQPLPEQGGLQRRQKAGEEGPLPCVTNGSRIFRRRLHRPPEAAGIPPALVGADGIAQIVVAGVVEEGQGQRRDQADDQQRHADRRQQLFGDRGRPKRFHGRSSSPASRMASLP